MIAQGGLSPKITLPVITSRSPITPSGSWAQKARQISVYKEVAFSFDKIIVCEGKYFRNIPVQPVHSAKISPDLGKVELKPSKKSSYSFMSLDLAIYSLSQQNLRYNNKNYVSKS